MGKIIDLTNQQFGHLTVQERGPNKYGNKVAWYCQCDCGKICLITTNDLKQGKRTSCGCQKINRAKELGKNNLIDISNQKYGLLTVIKPTEKRSNSGEVIWECYCDCGNITYATKASLDKGDVKSCGCYRKMINQKNLLGQRFNKLLVVDYIYDKDNIPHILWNCQCDCGNKITVKPKNLLSGNTQSCGCLISKGEQKIMQILQQNNITFERQKSFSDCRFPDTNALAKFDFYLTDMNILIEYDGIQHFIATNNGWNTSKHLQEVKNKDSFKTKWCQQNNITLIRIPYLDYHKLNFNYIKEKINNENISIRFE